MRKLHFFSILVALSLATSSLRALPTGVVDGKLPGAFSVACGKQVYFSQGSLQAVFAAANTSTCTWKFADEQYESLGSGGANRYVSNNKVTSPGKVDLFGWVGSGSSLAAYGINNNNSGSNYGNSPLKADWGETMGSPWRTLTDSEFAWVLNSRTNAAGLRTMATIHGELGLILLPDGWNIETSALSSLEISMSNKDVSDGDWTILENEGAVFLPTGGMRGGTSVYSTDWGYYWSSNQGGHSTGYALCTLIRDGSAQPSGNLDKKNGCLVRLVQDVPDELVPPVPTASVASEPSAKEGLVYNGNNKALITAAGAATGGSVYYRYKNTLAADYTAWNVNLPYTINAGDYIVQWYVAHSGCYVDSEVEEIHVTIARASFTPSPMQTIAAASLLYNGSAQNLVTVSGSLQSGCEIQYSTNGTDWSTTIPQGTDVGDYIVYYKVVNAPNYETSSNTINVTINPCPTVYDNADPATVLSDLYTSGNASPLLVRRTIWADDEYNTICLPFALDASALAASPLAGYNRLKAFRGAQVSGTGASTNIDIFVEDATAIEAGVPYLISYPSAHADIENPVFEDITVTTTTPGSVSADGVTFQGMFAQVHIDQHNGTKDYLFLGENSQLYWPLTSEIGDESVKMLGFRAYFIIDRNDIPSLVAPRGTHARFVNAPKQPTAIEEINTTNCTKFIENGQLIILKNGIKYNAQGQVLK